MSDLPFSIKNILSGNIAKKEHLQWHFCPLFSRCPWSYVPRIQFSSSISKKMKRGKRSVFSKDQVAKLEKSFQKRVREAFVKVGSVFCPCNPNTPLFARKSSRQTVLFARRNNPDHLQRRPSWKLFSLFGGIFQRLHLSLLTPTTQKCNMYIRSNDSLSLQKYLAEKDKIFIATQLRLSRKQVLNT